MAKYYVNKDAQPTGEHEVHKLGCTWFPSNTIYLGEYNKCSDAIKKAKEHYSKVDGCYYCSKECHTR